MVWNFIKLGLRNIVKNPFVSMINILSLSLSMAVGLLVISIVITQYSYDQFHPDKERIYRVLTNIQLKDNNQFKCATTPMILSDELSQYKGSIEQVCTLAPIPYIPVIYGTKTLNLNGAITGPTFFQVFGFQLISGNKQTCLAQPNAVVICQNAALKIFGNLNCVGKVLILNGSLPVNISGVLKDPVGPSHLQYDFYLASNTNNFLNLPALTSESLKDWSYYSSAYTYCKLRTTASEKSFNALLAAISVKESKSVQFRHDESRFQFLAQPLLKISPGNNLMLDNTGAMNYSAVLVIVLCIVVIMVLTCLNYSGLTVARGLIRAKEIGVRKVLGASQKQIMLQFIIESVVLAFFSLLIACVILPFIPLNSSLQLLFSKVKVDGELLVTFLLFSAIVGLMSGFIPGLLLSQFKTVEVLKNLKNIRVLKNLNFRKTIVFVQFTISFILILNIVVINKQSSFMTGADYGFDKSNIIDFHVNNSKDILLLKNELMKYKEVLQVSALSDNFGYQPSGYIKSAFDKASTAASLCYYYIDEKTIPIFKLQLLAGSNFKQDSAFNRGKVILNEKAVHDLHLGNNENTVGKTIFLNDTTAVEVLGVIKDFNFQNFKVPISPLMLRYDEQYLSVVNARFATLNNARINRVFKNLKQRLGYTQKIDYESYELVYSRQQAHSGDLDMLIFLTSMFMIIAGLGLLGVCSYSIEQRMKEVNIRKILGASTSEIFVLLSKEFFYLIIIAGVVGLPIGYFMSIKFLQGFAFRTEIGIDTFFSGFLWSSLLGILIIMSQATKSVLQPITRRLD